jgi:hypothetical protein
VSPLSRAKRVAATGKVRVSVGRSRSADFNPERLSNAFRAPRLTRLRKMVLTQQATNTRLSCIEASDSARPRQRHHVGGSCPPLDHCHDVSRPCVECGSLLRCPVMALIDPRDARAAPADVVQYRLGDFETDAQAPQAGGNRSPQIVNAARYNRCYRLPESARRWRSLRW